MRILGSILVQYIENHFLKKNNKKGMCRSILPFKHKYETKCFLILAHLHFKTLELYYAFDFMIIFWLEWRHFPPWNVRQSLHQVSQLAVMSDV